MNEPADVLSNLVDLQFRHALAARGFSRAEVVAIRDAYEDAKFKALRAWIAIPDDATPTRRRRHATKRR